MYADSSLLIGSLVLVIHKLDNHIALLLADRPTQLDNQRCDLLFAGANIIASAGNQVNLQVIFEGIIG